jgi:hypothetical protein
MIDSIMTDTVEMLFGLIFLAAAVLVAAWYQFSFILRLRQGMPVVVKGKVTAAFLSEVAAVCSAEGMRGGWLGGMRRGKRTVLLFSWHFSSGVRQRLRNVWTVRA